MSDKTIKSEQEKLLDEISAILKQGGKTYDMIPQIEKAMIESSGSSFSERTPEAHGEVSPLEGIVRPTHGQKVYRVSVCAYEHGCPTLADFQAENDEQAAKIADNIISTWEEATGDSTYRWYVYPKDEPNKDIPV